jgi:hypothetical protein
MNFTDNKIKEEFNSNGYAQFIHFLMKIKSKKLRMR